MLSALFALSFAVGRGGQSPSPDPQRLDGYRLAVTFADGTSGVVDLARHIRAGGVFARLSDVNAFRLTFPYLRVNRLRWFACANLSTRVLSVGW